MASSSESPSIALALADAAAAASDEQLPDEGGGRPEDEEAHAPLGGDSAEKKQEIVMGDFDRKSEADQLDALNTSHRNKVMRQRCDQTSERPS